MHNAASVSPLTRLPVSSGMMRPVLCAKLSFPVKKRERTHSGSQAALAKGEGGHHSLSLVVEKKNKISVSKVA